MIVLPSYFSIEAFDGITHNNILKKIGHVSHLLRVINYLHTTLPANLQKQWEVQALLSHL